MKHILILLLIANISAVNAQEYLPVESILARISSVDTCIRNIRAYLHENPELSGKEFNTAAYIKDELARLGLPVFPVDGTGFYAVIDTDRPGKTIALRTDIDALPIDENPVNLKQKKRHISQTPGVSHACGHDGHTAILLGAAKVLLDLKPALSGKIILVFEEGEETNSGINPMIAALAKLKIDAIYGNHLKSNLETGRIYLKEGALMAGTGTIAFDILGKGGHASRPDLAINPVFAAANVLTAISIAWNNQRDITKPLTLGITQIHGGEIYNVIPNTVFVGGTIRFFDLDEGKRGFELIEKVSRDVARAHNCSIRLHDNMGVVMKPVMNDTALTILARNSIRRLYPDKVVEGDAFIWYAAETFARYAELAPAVFAFVGIRNDSLGSGAEHHNDQFDIDEDALQYGVGGMVMFALGVCGSR
jgi:amidohydrolase